MVGSILESSTVEVGSVNEVGSIVGVGAVLQPVRMSNPTKRQNEIGIVRLESCFISKFPINSHCDYYHNKYTYSKGYVNKTIIRSA